MSRASQSLLYTYRAMARLNYFGAGAQRAVLVAIDELFGMTRQHQMLSDESLEELQTFRKVDDPLRWVWMPDAKAELLSALSLASTIPVRD